MLKATSALMLMNVLKLTMFAGIVEVFVIISLVVMNAFVQMVSIC